MSGSNGTTKHQSGQLMIIVAVGMVVFMGFAAMVVDLGNAYAQRRQVQNAADAAAMAATWKMRAQAVTVGDVTDEIVRVATLNGATRIQRIDFLGVDPSTVLGTAVGSSATPQSFTYSGLSAASSVASVAGVRVASYKSFETFFAGVFGALLPTIGGTSADITSLTASGGAAAMSMEIGAVTGTGLWPIATRDQTFTVGVEYTIWDDAMEVAGNAGWLNVDGGPASASELSDWAVDGFLSSDANRFAYYEDAAGPSVGSYQQGKTLPFPSWLEASTGNVTSALQDMSVSETITVIVFSALQGTGVNGRYRAVGLASFTVTSVTTTGSNKRIRGIFQNIVVPGDASSTYTTGSASTIRLVPNLAPGS